MDPNMKYCIGVRHIKNGELIDGIYAVNSSAYPSAPLLFYVLPNNPQYLSNPDIFCKKVMVPVFKTASEAETYAKDLKKICRSKFKRYSKENNVPYSEFRVYPLKTYSTKNPLNFSLSEIISGHMYAKVSYKQ